MQLIIHENQSISAIQAAFSRQFPYLKLEFIAAPSITGRLTIKNYKDSQNKLLSQFRTVHNSECITVTPEMTVEKLEQQFHNLFGLAVQVFRKSGNVWIETTVTDNWTLQKQNKQGEELSKLQGEKLFVGKFKPDSQH
jgi:hypothetical protein